jgi:hypothetical protein
MQVGLEIGAFSNRIFGPDNKSIVVVIDTRRLPSKVIPLGATILIHMLICFDDFGIVGGILTVRLGRLDVSRTSSPTIPSRLLAV